jgi:hypothetical protein
MVEHPDIHPLRTTTDVDKFAALGRCSSDSAGPVISDTARLGAGI